LTAELQWSWIFRMVSVINFTGPEPASCAEFGDFFKEVVVDVEKRRELRGKTVNGKSGLHCCLNVGQPVIQGEGQFLHRRRSCLPDVVTADADRMPLGNLCHTVCDGGGAEAQGGFGREEPG